MFPPADGLKYYPDQPVISDSETPTGLQGMRVDSVAVVPTKAGHYRIPELRIPWWDTRSNELRYAVLPARELDISGTGPATTPAAPAPCCGAGTGGTGALRPDDDSDHRRRQPTLADRQRGHRHRLAGHAALPAVVAAQAQRPGRGSCSRYRRKKAFKALLAACDAGDPQRARQATIQWAAALLSQPGMASLARGRGVRDTAMDTALAALNASLYRDRQAAWDGAALAAACQRLA